MKAENNNKDIAHTLQAFIQNEEDDSFITFLTKEGVMSTDIDSVCMLLLFEPKVFCLSGLTRAGS